MEEGPEPTAEALLAENAAALETKWTGLSDEDLLEEIKKYKDAVKSVSTKLARLGRLTLSSERKPGFCAWQFTDHFQILNSNSRPLFSIFRRRCPFW